MTKSTDTLLKSATKSSLQNGTDVSLQNATILFQNATFITNETVQLFTTRYYLID